ncbi:MAG TPA: TonB-dependent receptor [Blastocatellia bacterium]|nr:TonB-dependent receptor [Blastocatellia bacterium]
MNNCRKRLPHLIGRRAKSTLSALLTLLLIGGSIQAQTGTSSVRGTVVDAQGKVVSGATVKIKNDAKNFLRSQTTNESGLYAFTALPPDTYSVEAEAAGFKKAVVSGVRAAVDTPAVVDLKLEVGGVTETVTVAAGGGEVINKQDASLGNAFEAKRIEELPLNARNIVGLLSLQPGVTRDGFVNGGRSDQANVTLDGVDSNEQQTGLDIATGEAFASVLRSTVDSMQEFRVTTTNANADAGRSSGAQVSLITRSGTNQFHGSLYEYHRNTATTSNDFFNNAAGVEKPQLLRNIFGGAIGGPIKRDRAFFFFTYEGFRERTGQSVVREVPLPSLGQGIVRYFSASGDNGAGCPPGTPSGVICLNRSQIGQAYLAANGIDPGTNSAAIAVLADAARRYKANDTTVGDGLNTGGFRFNANTPSNLGVYHLKFDYNLTDHQSVFVRGSYQNDKITQVRRFPDTPAPLLWNHPKGLALGHTWTASNTLVNNFRYGLTRAAFTSEGDSNQNNIFFRFIYQPVNFSRTLARTTPVHNIKDDVSWVKGSHATQFGGDVRLISNTRFSFGSTFDNAITNPSFYDFSGDVVIFSEENLDPIFPDVSGSSETDLRDALTALIGRFSQFGTNINYDESGKLLATGSGIPRTFATQEYELYWQDSWRWKPNLTITYGMRWSTSTPVYEANGVQVTPTQSLGKFFDDRVASAEKGIPFNALITVDKAGRKNDRPGYYDQDWNNFAPSIAVAWSPDFGDNFFGRLFGRNGKSVLRGGFRMVYDRIGSQLAVTFDLNSTLGFHSFKGVSANTFNVGSRLGPSFTGFGQAVRPLLAAQGVTVASSVSFPQTTPADEDQRIESSLDDTLTTPVNYSVNLSYGREVGHGLSFEMSYVGRFARDLLATRDVMHLNNIRDPRSGMDFYSAINKLIDFRYQNRAITSIDNIPFFENLLPGLAGTFNVLGRSVRLSATQAAYRRLAQTSVGGRNITDYTFLQLLWDDQPQSIFNNTFFHPQYAAFSVFSTIAKSNYNSAQFSVRERIKDLTLDFNYTFAHSLDSASGLQTSGTYGTAFIVNPLDPDLNYASSDFDIRHIVNANFVAGLPFGRGKRFLTESSGVADAFLGGWQLTGIFRWNSGLAAGEPFEADRWATNWNVQSNMVRVRRLVSSPTKKGEPNIFSNPGEAYRSFRDPRAGEVGDRNILREPGYVSLDIGLYKTFKIRERQALTFRWEVFNITNTQRLTGVTGFNMEQDPFLPNSDGTPKEPPSEFGKFTAVQTPLNETKGGRVMQFALRFTF